MFKRFEYYFCFITIFYDHSGKATPISGSSVIKAEVNELPFIVSISRNSSSLLGAPEAYHKCTGTLVSLTHVLTAAHCFRGIQDYNSFVVKVGSNDLRNTEIHKISWWVTYNEWLDNQLPDDNNRNTFYDIAIVKLEKGVNPNIKIAHLPTAADDKLYGKPALAAGWGRTDSEEKPRDLHIGKLNVLPCGECLFNKIPIDSFDVNTKKSLLCTMAEPTVCLEEGDSGGPLLANKTEIIGVNVGDCFQNTNCDLPPIQNIHSSIHYYLHYINDVIGNV